MPGHDRITPQGKDFFNQIEELCKLQVRVGFQQGAASDEETGADIADIAAWNELGTARSPPRPFLRQSVENNESQIKAMCEKQLTWIVKGEATARDALQALGVMQKALIQKTISSGSFEPNAPRTIEKKGSDKPLIDTRRMRQSVNFVIQEKGSD